MRKKEKAGIGTGILVALFVFYVYGKQFIQQHPVWSILIGVGLLTIIGLGIYYAIKRPEIREKEISFFKFLWEAIAAAGGGKERKKKTQPSQKTRMKALERAGHKCQICGSSTTPQIHHIDKNHENHSLGNLIVLCPTHHKEADNNVIRKETLKSAMHKQVVQKRKYV